jgi:hypothetical protein
VPGFARVAHIYYKVPLLNWKNSLLFMIPAINLSAVTFQGCTNDELQEQFAFNLAKPHVAKQIARYGLFCKKKLRNAIGDSAYGVNLVMHADVVLEFGAYSGYKPPFTVMIYKVSLYRVSQKVILILISQFAYF